ncbi:MAG: hypothetical protein U0235_08975 [Polyangiaceae bacterium]
MSFSRSSYVFFFAPLVVACGGTAQAPEQRYAVVSLDLRPSSSGQLAAEAFGVFGTYDDGPCAPETIGACVVDACRRDFAYHDGGALRVESEGTLSMSVPRASDGRYSGPSAAVGALPAAGSAVRVTTDGAEVPPLDATLRFPAPIRLENPSPVSGFTSGTSNATLAYEGGGDVEIRFAPAAESSLHGEAAGSPSVACTWDGSSRGPRGIAGGRACPARWPPAHAAHDAAGHGARGRAERRRGRRGAGAGAAHRGARRSGRARRGRRSAALSRGE